MLRYPFMVFFGDTPKPRSSTARNKVSIGDVKDIAQPFPRAGIIDQRNAFGPLIYPASHLAIPSLQLCTGSCPRTLGMNQERVSKVIAVQLRGCIEIIQPFFRVAADFLGMG